MISTPFFVNSPSLIISIENHAHTVFIVNIASDSEKVLLFDFKFQISISFIFKSNEKSSIKKIIDLVVLFHTLSEISKSILYFQYFKSLASYITQVDVIFLQDKSIFVEEISEPHSLQSHFVNEILSDSISIHTHSSSSL
jgi:hypothetical protein